MGSQTSAELQHTATPCAVIQLQTWKGDAMETLLMVPATEEVFAHSADHPLFQLLHTARNEPAVRHWYAGGSSGAEVVDRTSILQPATHPDELYAEIFGASFPLCHSNEDSTSSNASSSGRVSTNASSCTTTSSYDAPPIPSRWIMMTVNPSSVPTGDGFLTVAQATALAQTNCLTAAGFIEGSHATLATTLRYWMVKTFSTEGRSLVLFQAAAFMEARRMQLANLRAVNPTAMEFSLRLGDVSSLRMLEASFRRLLPAQASSHHQSVSVHPSRSRSTKADTVTVRVHGGALGAILQQFEYAVKYPLRRVNGMAWLSLAVEQSTVQRILTPFAPAIETAKPLWAAENAIVAQVQPNQRQIPKGNPTPAYSAPHSNNNNVRHSSNYHNNTTPSNYYVTPMSNPICSTSSNNEAPAAAATYRLSTPYVQHNPYAQSPRSTKLNPVEASYQPTAQPTTSSTVNNQQQKRYLLPNNTPIHYLDPQSGQWLPLFYQDVGARLQLAPVQEYHQDGKLTLETADALTFEDAYGNPTSVMACPKDLPTKRNWFVCSLSNQLLQ